MARRKILPIFLPQAGCENQCIFCNQRGISGVARPPHESELENLLPQGGEDYELAFYGGSFTSLPYDAMLAYLKFGEKMRRQGRIGSIRISTHPASVNEETIAILKSFGVDVIELGVQSLADEVLQKAGRNYTKREVLYSMFLVKNNGFKLGVQLMVGLPLETPAQIFRGIEELLPFAPDMVRIYPLLVLKNTTLAADYKKGKYQPLSLANAVELVRDMAAVFYYYQIPIIRMGLHAGGDLQQGSDLLLAGPFHPAFGYLVKAALKLKQMEMALAQAPPKCRLVVPARELSEAMGEYGSNMKALDRQYHLKISGSGAKDGAVAIAPYEQAKKGEILSELTQHQFLTRYLNENEFWSKHCI